MPRVARCVVPEVPHHITQRGNRRQVAFFSPQDYQLYKSLLKTTCDREGVGIWAYCLMPNHVHLILCPSTAASLARAMKSTHQRYSRIINSRMDWSGHLWQSRFWSCAMDEQYLKSAVRYTLRNPVRDGLADHAEHWQHSSATAHLSGRSDGTVDIGPLAERISDWEDFLEQRTEPTEARVLVTQARYGLPAGNKDFVESLEARFERRLTRQSVGRPSVERQR
jgi:putative transposase